MEFLIRVRRLGAWVTVGTFDRQETITFIENYTGNLHARVRVYAIEQDTPAPIEMTYVAGARSRKWFIGTFPAFATTV